MAVGPEPDRGVRFARLRLLLPVVVIGVLAGFAGFTMAADRADRPSSPPADRSDEPSGPPAEWSQADWIAHDPALDPAAWKDARIVPMDCPATATDSKCWAAEGYPKVNHDAPTPWPQRKLWCEEALAPDQSTVNPVCDAQPIPDSYSADKKAELEAYGVDRAFGGAAKR